MDTEQEKRLERLRDRAQVWLGTDDPQVETGAIIETAFLMAAADGELSDAEHQQLLATIEFITANQYPPARLRAMVAQLLDALQTDGWEKRIAAVADSLTSPEARRNAYRVAAGVSFIDGVVQDTEAQLFGLLAQAFEIPTDEASKILVEVRDELFAPGDGESEGEPTGRFKRPAT